MQRLTHKRENGIKRGYWSPNKKQELVDRLAMYEDAEEKEEFGKWIPISERLPESDEYILISCSNYTGLCIDTRNTKMAAETFTKAMMMMRCFPMDYL